MDDVSSVSPASVVPVVLVVEVVVVAGSFEVTVLAVVTVVVVGGPALPSGSSPVVVEVLSPEVAVMASGSSSSP